MREILSKKLNRLENYLREHEKIAVAYSSGVDSTFLLTVARNILGDNVLAITAESECFPKSENEESNKFCIDNGIKHLKMNISELEIDGFKDNPANRCYICKKELFTKMKDVAAENGFTNLAEGSNLDDIGDYRPGMKAVEELGILSPLRECEFTKAEIRELSNELNLYTWDKPSFACLASRFPYGEKITYEKLKMVEGAEEILANFGFRQKRVRIHGNVARIEILDIDFEKIIDGKIRTEIVCKFKEIGFSYISLDLQGYRTGSMNEVI